MLFEGNLYLEDGLHRAVRSALRNRTIIHARILDLDERSTSGAVAPSLNGAASPLETTAPIEPVGRRLHPSRRRTGAHRLFE